MSKIAIQVDDDNALQLCLDAVKVGDIAVLFKSHTPIAEVSPVTFTPEDKTPRKVGLFAGMIRMSDNFNDPDPEFEDLFYNGRVFP